MNNKKSCQKVLLGLGVLSGGAFLAGTTAFASSGLVPPGFNAGNPASPSLTQSRLANQRLIDMSMKTVSHAAAETNAWFQNASVFGEYGFTDTQDERQGGFDTSTHSGTLGLNFQTKGDVGLGLMLNYGSTSGHADFPGRITDDANNMGATLSAIKNFDWFFIGLSGSYDYNDTLMVTPVGNRLKTYADSYTLAPFIGAMYVKGNFSFSTAPTFVMRWQEFNYNTAPGDASSDATFVLMNKVSYNVTEKLTLALVANWTCVMDEHLTRLPQPQADSDWFTVGPKIDYSFTDKLSAYVAYTIDLGTSTYDNQQVTAGLSFNF